MGQKNGHNNRNSYLYICSGHQFQLNDSHEQPAIVKIKPALFPVWLDRIVLRCFHFL